MATERDTQLLPSQFMRQWRPEVYSDTKDRVSYLLESKLVEYCLDSVTSRNEMHDFEIFCRKLCERTICPNLMPSTGPEGGGDSKADTETYPVAEEIAELTYVGYTAASQERWAFAFSAKKTWASKIRSDVAGIIATERSYAKIICITAQFAPAKKRAALEDELTSTYGVRVSILDRSWIVEQVTERAHGDLAHHYLHVGEEVVDSRRLGPTDYSRSQQLEDIEEALARPEAFVGMEMQRATEALVAAELSRNLERPRTETEGRLERAIRMAERYGTDRQKLEAHYEKLWTAFWWFDDIAMMNNGYGAFEQMALGTDHARNLELLCNLAQLLFNSVIHGHLAPEEAQLDERVGRLRDRLAVMAAETERPNHALEARTSLLLLDVNSAMFDRDTERLSLLWRQFSEVISQARGLGEFAADRLRRLIEAFGYVSAGDPGYATLVDELAEFIAERTGEAQGALVLLQRAKQLNFKDNFEMIRLLGKAARQLTKKEYAEALIEATSLLALAYRSAGLLWAARASCVFSIASIFVVAEEDHDLPASIIPTLMILAWVTVELRHLPDFLETVQLIQGCRTSLPLDEPSQERVAKRIMDLDLVFASRLLNFSETDLSELTHMPEVFERLGLVHSRNALLYAMGHELKLRREGSIPADEPAQKVAEFFSLLASQPAADNSDFPLLFNEGHRQRLVSRVQGILIAVEHPCTEISIPAAEAIIGVIEAVFATILSLKIAAHTERFTIVLQESAELSVPESSLNPDDMIATVKWPTSVAVGSHAKAQEIQLFLTQLAASILATTCYVPDVKVLLQKLFASEAAPDRVALIVAASNSRQRLFNHRFSRMSKWSELADTEFALEDERPKIKRVTLKSRSDDGANVDQEANPLSTLRDHRHVGVRSVIDVHLWNRAGWHGAAFLGFPPGSPPELALLFTDREAAAKIFSHWRERFGGEDRAEEIHLAVIRGISLQNPAHYRVFITSSRQSSDESPEGMTYSIVSRMITMEVANDANLNRFLADYRREGAYQLTPAVMVNGTPEFLSDMGVLKRNLAVRNVSEIGEHDLDAMALGEDLFRERFGKAACDDDDHKD